MDTLRQSFVFIPMFALLGCGQDQSKELPEPEVDEVEQSLSTEKHLPTHTYYTIRKDERLCPSPMCGGYFVSELNRATTVCGDGSRNSDGCYVSELELPGVVLSKGDVLHGTVVPKNYPGAGTFDTFEADAVYTRVLDESPAYDWVDLVHDTGIRCVTTPCPSGRIAMINTRLAWTSWGYAFEAASEPDRVRLQSAFVEGYANLGSLVEGYWDLAWRDWDMLWEFKVTNVLTPKASPEPPVCVVLQKGGSTTVAWNYDDRREAEAFATASGAAVLEGACASQSFICAAVVTPVHGTIDALGDECVEAENPCRFAEAVVRAAGPAQPGKARGTWEAGSCAEPETGCLVFTDDGWTWAYNTDSDYKDAVVGYDTLSWYPGENCADVVRGCTKQYVPVCGRVEPLNAPSYTRTFPNRCVFDSAVRAAVGANHKARGEVERVGTCAEVINSEQACLAAGGYAIWSPGSVVHCPAGEVQIGVIPVGIEGGICCR